MLNTQHFIDLLYWENKSLHVLSKGAALNKAVGCLGCLYSFSLFKQCAAVKKLKFGSFEWITHRLKLCDSVLDCS